MSVAYSQSPAGSSTPFQKGFSLQHPSDLHDAELDERCEHSNRCSCRQGHGEVLDWERSTLYKAFGAFSPIYFTSLAIIGGYDSCQGRVYWLWRGNGGRSCRYNGECAEGEEGDVKSVEMHGEVVVGWRGGFVR